ncbi:hypothetical protein F5B19DRAFT_504743 [Rostrohypoxylon terebratum]|nr:hypothetical protein F5B19DRAFT_504743 [Rostrohypoxylon terebratum]
MDPVTAFATAGTIATFIQIGFHLVVNIYTIYNTTSGMVKEDEQLGFYIDKLAGLSRSMVSTKPTLDLSDAEKGMEAVASRCLNLSDELVRILNQSKAKRSHSIQESAIAVFHDLVDKSKKEELKKELDECQKLFHMQLSRMISSDTVQGLKKLDDLAKSNKHTGREIAALRRHILQLEQKVEEGFTSKNIGEDAADQFARLIKVSSESVISIKSRQILESLSFSKLHQRYGTVLKAHMETFNWIFQNDPDKSPKALQGKILFSKWLSSGNGIFHIVGKPGSGKSTLMKFIYQHQETKNLLNSWAAGRKLILSKYFFWKPGGDTLEHSISGMLQTLLYDVLNQCPQLVPCVFPHQWAQVKDLPVFASTKVHFDPDDYRNAFDLMIDNRDVLENRCFFFMVDGLDEYQETTNEGYKELIKLLSSWSEKAPEQIKLCVSSREYDVFLDAFSEAQGLRLQDLTADDIHNYVKEKLESNQNFRNMDKPEDGPNILISNVTQKAHGVFLWVALVVKLLDDACDEEDSFDDLVKKIDFLPPEVRDLFDELFNSIREPDRDESAQTFAVALKMLQNQHGMRLSLLRYSLLDDYHANPLFASSLDCLSRIIVDWNDEAFRRRLKRAHKQLYKRCRGLLEVIESDDDTASQISGSKMDFKDTPLSKRISLIHRSVQEYLEEKQISEERAARTKNFDVTDAICQTYIAELITVKKKHPYLNDRCYTYELLDIIAMILKTPQDAVQQKCITALQNLDKSRPRYLRGDNCHFNFNLGRHDSMETLYINGHFSVAHTAAVHGFDIFFTRGDQCDATMRKDIKNGSLLLAAQFGLMFRMGHLVFDVKRHLSLFRWLFVNGCSPNQVISKRHRSLWWELLATLPFYLRCNWNPIFYIIEIYLEYGANPDFYFLMAREDKPGGDLVVQISQPAATETSTVNFSMPLYDSSFTKDTATLALISSRSGRATFRELLADIRPPNLETLLAFIDRNLKAQRLDPQTLALSDGALVPSVPPSEQATNRGELVESADINQETDSKPDNEVITEKQGYQMETLFKSLMSNSLATFMLGVFLTYCFLVVYNARNNYTPLHWCARTPDNSIQFDYTGSVFIYVMDQTYWCCLHSKSETLVTDHPICIIR